MTREGKIAAFLMLGGAATVGAAWWSSRDEDGGLLETIIDRVSLLTSSEASRMAKLNADTQDKLNELIFALAQGGLKVYVGQTLRTAAEEQANIDAGKTSANLKYSWHSLGRAVDLYPIDPATGKADLAGRRVDLFREMHAKAAAMGFRGIAFNADGSKRVIINSKGKGIWDGGHIEDRGSYATIAQAVAAEGAQFGIA